MLFSTSDHIYSNGDSNMSNTFPEFNSCFSELQKLVA